MTDPKKLLLQFEDAAAEAQRQKAEADALFESLGDGAIATDIYGRISKINQTALNLLGLSENKVVGEWFPKVIHAETENGQALNLFDRPITKAFLTGKSVSQKLFYRIDEATALPVAVTVSPIMLNDKPVGAVEVFRDITLEHNIDKMKSEFISIASHQLRTPLSAIKTYSHLLAEEYMGPLSKEQKELTDIIMNSIDRMNDLIDTLLDISKIERGRLGLDIKYSNLSKLMADIMQEMHQYAEGKKIELKPDAEPNLSTNTDPVLAREVFANLISNAIKYTPDGGKVSVSLKRKENEIVLAVKDTGFGIPSHVQDRIFTKFFRAPNVIQKETSGTGLGLYMVKSIADNLGGKIWFKSKEDHGSTFYFSIPITKAAVSKKPAAVPERDIITK